MIKQKKTPNYSIKEDYKGYSNSLFVNNTPSFIR